MSTDFGRRLLLARRYAGLTQKRLAELAEMSQSNLSDLERIAYESGKTAQLAAACGVDAQWLATGEGAMIPAAPSPSYFSPRTPEASTLQFHTVEPTIDWEKLMNADEDLPPTFSLVLADDAMATKGSSIGRGVKVSFRRSCTSEPGDAVLVRDRLGRVHFRLHRLKRSGAWEAFALNQAYPSFDSVEDELRVIAVFTGFTLEGSWSQLVG